MITSITDLMTQNTNVENRAMPNLDSKGLTPKQSSLHQLSASIMRKKKKKRFEARDLILFFNQQSILIIVLKNNCKFE